MGHGKETPRQKMIGMMYLVLTALLALNVQKSVLDAFTNVDHGINKVMHNFMERNENLYADFEQKAIVNQAKVGPYFERAREIQEKADALYEEIQEAKIAIIKTSEGEDSPALADEHHIDLALVDGKDKTDVPAQIMVTEKRAIELKKNFEDFRELLIETVGQDFPDIIESIEKSLSTEDHELPDGSKHAWESANFEHLPLAGVIAIMSGLQTDIRNSESEVINHLYSQIDAGSFKFNKLEPIVIPNTNYVIKGNNYEAKVFLAAYDTTQKPTIYIGKPEKYTTQDGTERYRMIGSYDSLEIDESGKGLFRRAGTTMGDYNWGGIIRLKKSDGTFIEKEFKEEYSVAESNVVVSPTKMNVFYMNVPNPVKISVAGVPADKIFPEISNGKISRNGSIYTVEPKRRGDCMISVFAEIDGQRKLVGTEPFRVKPIPDPIAKVAGKTAGNIDKNYLLAQTGVQADLENFDFDLQFVVTEFVVSASIRGLEQSYQIKGTNRFSPQQLGLIQNLRKGDKVYIEDIKAVGPDGAARTLQSIIFKLN